MRSCRSRPTSARVDLLLLAGVVDLASHLVQGLGVVQLAQEPLVVPEVVVDPGQLTGDPAGGVGVVPQVGTRRLRLEQRLAGPQLLDLQVGGRVVEALPRLDQLVGEVAHAALRPRRRGSACTSCRSHKGTVRCVAVLSSSDF